MTDREKPYARYLQRIYKEVLYTAGVPGPAFDRDEEGKLQPQFDDENTRSLSNYIEHVRNDTNFFADCLNTYVVQYDERLGGYWPKNRKQSIAWTMAVIAVGESEISKNDSMAKGPLAHDIRALGLIKKVDLSSDLANLCREGIVHPMADLNLEYLNQVGEVRPRLRYTLEEPKKGGGEPVKIFSLPPILPSLGSKPAVIPTN